jgi:hypothetical protein
LHSDSQNIPAPLLKVLFELTSQSLRPTHHLPFGEKELISLLVQVACGILQVKDE